jgi:galactose oxidase
MRRPGIGGPLTALFAGMAATACQDTAKPGPAENGPSSVAVTYLCGNEFLLQHRNSQPITVHYAVHGTSEAGELLLPGDTISEGSSTRLITLRQGTLEVSLPDQWVTRVDNQAAACPPGNTNQLQARMGEWSPPFPWPVVAVHLHLLPSGRVLSWGRIGDPQVYDPADGSFTAAPSATMVFCAGHTFLPDGRLLVSGGHLDDERGLRDANIFTGDGESWLPIPPMGFARWYPTNTTLPNGDILTLGGTDESGEDVPTPELWDGNTWRPLPDADRALPYYPRTFVAPNGLVFYAGELQQTAYLDLTGLGRWIPLADSRYGRRDYGSAVMYSPGKVMILGGSDPPDGAPTATAELIDLTAANPVWQYTEPMRFARRHLNATLLPDGQILVTGGTSSPGFSDPAGAVHAAELWDPTTGHWSELAANQVRRVYHSSSLLLPDGRVLHTGSGDGLRLPRELNAELFSPPYLYRGARPTIGELPKELGYGQSFFISTPDAAQVVRVTLVRLGSVTHAFDQSQLFAELDLRRTAGGINARTPESGAVAPPGPYLLTILNGAGVPSVSRIVSLR